MINNLKRYLLKWLERIKLVFICIGIFFVLRLCYIVDDKPVITPETRKKYSAKKPSAISNNTGITNKLTVEKTNQEYLKRKHNSKYSSNDRVVEPIGMND